MKKDDSKSGINRFIPKRPSFSIPSVSINNSYNRGFNKPGIKYYNRFNSSKTTSYVSYLRFNKKYS